MGYSRNKLTAKAIKALPEGSHGDGGGLWLRKGEGGTGQWVYRFRLHGRQRQMGLGSLSKVPLAKAREFRDKYQNWVVEELDPVAERKLLSKNAQEKMITVEEVAIAAFKARQAELKGDGKAGRWFSPIELHILPKLGKHPIVQVTQFDIQDTLLPIWDKKAVTARKALNRLNIVFKHAAALGLEVDMQASDKAKALLGQQRHTPRNIGAMSWKEVPAFYSSLTERSPVQLALRLLILNPGPRSKPIRFANLDQIKGDVWTIPGELMKGVKGKQLEWRTPLTAQSLDIIEQAKPFERDGILFPNVTGKGVISDASMSRLMERRQIDARPHGFRSSFRTWAAETGQRRDIAELCLAHKIYGKVEASYLRSDQLEDRKKLMIKWADYVTGKVA